VDWGVAGGAGGGVAIGAAAPDSEGRKKLGSGMNTFKEKKIFPAFNKARVLEAHKGKANKCGFLNFLSFPDRALWHMCCIYAFSSYI